jgi:predicted transcriptional regulator
MTDQIRGNTIALTGDIVSAFVSYNAVRADDLPSLIGSVYSSLKRMAEPQPRAAPTAILTPAIPIKKSVTDDYLISLEDGKKFKSLKRHLLTAYGKRWPDLSGQGSGFFKWNPAGVLPWLYRHAGRA